MPHSDKISDKIQSLDLIFSYPNHEIDSYDFLRDILNFEAYISCLILKNKEFDGDEMNNRDR